MSPMETTKEDALLLSKATGGKITPEEWTFAIEVTKLMDLQHRQSKESEGTPMSRKGRKPTATAEHNLPTGEMKPPNDLNAEAKKEWNRVVKALPDGVLSLLDYGILTAYCSAWSEWRTAEAKCKGKEVIATPSGSLQVNPLMSISRNARKEFWKYAQELGFTPSARTRLRVPTPAKPEKVSKDDRILRRK